jgi:hypothetical protein
VALTKPRLCFDDGFTQVTPHLYVFLFSFSSLLSSSELFCSEFEPKWDSLMIANWNEIENEMAGTLLSYSTSPLPFSSSILFCSHTHNDEIKLKINTVISTYPKNFKDRKDVKTWDRSPTIPQVEFCLNFV